jgi:aminomethyltransferase
MRTPLYDRHVALGARMVDFAGWEMPVQYAGILTEHEQTRTHVSLFDTCHMSEFRVWGARAEQVLSGAVACCVSGLPEGRCRYGFLLNERGGVLDDLICYRIQFEEFMVVANAGTRRRDGEVLEERLKGAVLDDISDETGKIDLQGPDSLGVLNGLSDGTAGSIPYYGFRYMMVAGIDTLVSRTGYTGELGYELYAPTYRIGALWDALLGSDGVEPAGLGARDTLRLEMGYPLYGHEMDETVTPVEAGFGRMVPRGIYPGADAIARQLKRGVDEQLVGIEFEGRRAARAGDPVFRAGTEAGRVTSGSFAPSVGCAIALARVAADAAGPGTALEADVRGSRIPGRVVDLPFYKDGTVRAETS